MCEGVVIRGVSWHWGALKGREEREKKRGVGGILALIKSAGMFTLL